MLKVLLKKQLAEVFRSYFYDAKKNKMRPKWSIALWFVFFFVIMVGMLGGMFTFLSLSLCEGLAAAGMGWLYFLLLSGLAVLLGAFGSVFNTYSGLYLAKDNDLLLSMPIPVGTIITARLMNVYLLGTMYAATVLIPALIVNWIVTGISAASLVCGILLFLIVTIIVLLLSCVLGWVVAKISLKLKNKSFITVLIALVCIGLYYFFYFRASAMIRDLIAHASVYGEKIKGAAYVLYLFGRIGEGDLVSALVFAVVTALLFGLVAFVLSRSFLSIATAGGKTGKVRYTERRVSQKSVFRALLEKELGRFTSSANYMLNCGLGVLLLPASGILMLLKGPEVFGMFNEVFAGVPGIPAVILCAVLCLIAGMNDMAAPMVSLEGKNIWIPQSLPVEPKTVLRAKMCVQLLLTGLPVLFAAVCVSAAVAVPVPLRIMMCVTPLSFTVFSAVFDMFMGIRMPIMNWTSEVMPIKQGGAVTIALFGGWLVSLAFGGLYFAVGTTIDPVLYMLLWTVLFLAGAFFLLRWLDTKGAAAFSAL